MIDFDDIDIEETKQSDSLLTDEEFVFFLKSHNVYDYFINNLKKEKKRTYPEFFGRHWFGIDTFCADICKMVSRDNYINYAFVWGSTQQGCHSWSVISKLWKNKIKQLTYYEKNRF